MYRRIALRLFLWISAYAIAGCSSGQKEDVESAGEHSARVTEAGAEQGAVMRNALLSRRMLASLPPSESGAFRGAVMDWNVGTGLATLVAIDDGTVSMYLVPGGGTIGAGSHPNVAPAAVAFREQAAMARSAFSLVEAYPAPGRDSVVFYLLTDSATLATDPIGIDVLQDAEHPLAGLNSAAQALIAEIHRAESASMNPKSH